jgi:mono/diheme cytochrome c family protein
MMTRKFYAGLVGAALLMAGATGGRANEGEAAEDLAEQGKALAALNCARCHALGREGESPMEGAPPFREFAAKWPLDALEEALAEGIVTGHPEMPEFKLTPDQISAFIAYLETLGE